YLLLKRRLHSWAILSTFAAILYLCASWWAYRFDCAFGYRSFVEYYPLFIIPVAALIEKLLKPGSAWWKPTLFFLLATFFIYVNMRLCLGPAQLTWCSKEYFWPDYWKMMQTIYTF
ncbi:MAG TPA: hypothetical protein VFU15_17750, partial [Bacteroidia bacterium]|nr:hypothetical protein [Bacteroidia bacterium]